jgi:hypothetical protein
VADWAKGFASPSGYCEKAPGCGVALDDSEFGHHRDAKCGHYQAIKERERYIKQFGFELPVDMGKHDCLIPHLAGVTANTMASSQSQHERFIADNSQPKKEPTCPYMSTLAATVVTRSKRLCAVIPCRNAPNASPFP